MKNRVTPINAEIRLRDDHLLISKTDPKGRLTYCNREFIHISGYSEMELLGQQHNIVRHPDMPRGVFRLLWNTLSSGNEFFGYIKNMTKDGRFYWVMATVTPSYTSLGQLAGYASVRRKPRDGFAQTIEPLYAEMLEVERNHGAADAPDASIRLLEQRMAEMNTEYEPFILTI